MEMFGSYIWSPWESGATTSYHDFLVAAIVPANQQLADAVPYSFDQGRRFPSRLVVKAHHLPGLCPPPVIANP